MVADFAATRLVHSGQRVLASLMCDRSIHPTAQRLAWRDRGVGPIVKPAVAAG